MLTISVYVSPRAAIFAGKTRVGAQSLSLDDKLLEALPENLRYELALAYENGEPLGKAEGEPDIVEPSIEALKPALEWRAARRAALEDEKKKQTARAAEEAAVSSRELTAKDNARSKALRSWIDKHGDEEQKARMAEGFLPEDEILDMVCDELLELPGFGPYDALLKGNACECACAGNVKMTVGAPRYMDATQFAKLQAAREAAPEGATVTAYEHRAACPSCKCVPLARLEARVEMPWHGWKLVKQYALR
jgi:hypothetical protein